MKYMVAKVYFDARTENSYEKFHLLNLKFAELGCKIVSLPNFQQKETLNNIVSVEDYMSKSERERSIEFVENAKVQGVFKVLIPEDKADEYVQWTKYQKFRNSAYYVEESEALIKKAIDDAEELIRDLHSDA